MTPRSFQVRSFGRRGCTPLVLASIALFGGCQQPAEPAPTWTGSVSTTPAPVPPANNAPVPATQPQPATRPVTRPAATSTDVARPNQWEAGVAEIITKPTLATRPATRPAGAPTPPPTNIAAPAAIDAPTPVFTFDDLKRVDTSLATAPLVRLLAMKLNNIPYTRFAGYGAIDFTPDLPEGNNPDSITNEVLFREPAGSSEAIQRLIAGESDLAFVARYPTDAEIAAAEAKGVKLRSDLVATEALVFMVNERNPLKSISIDKLTAIFSGQAKKWADLKLDAISLNNPIANAPITVAYRARGLGTQELIEQLLLNGKPMPELPVSKALASAKLVLDAHTEDPETLGFSVFVYAANMQRSGRIRVLAVEGVQPEPGRVASREYPLTTPIYVISRTNLENSSNLSGLRKWLLAMPGQQALAEAGYMPIVTQAWTEQRLMTNDNK